MAYDKEEELRLLQEERVQLHQLIESTGWKWFVQLANDNFDDLFENQVVLKPRGLDDVVIKMYEMGECAGFRRIVNIPALRVSVLDEEIKALLDELNPEEGETNE